MASFIQKMKESFSSLVKLIDKSISKTATYWQEYFQNGH